MTHEGDRRHPAPRREITLVFDAAGRLVSWEAGAGALPGAASLLVPGTPASALEPLATALGPVARTTDRPLADGGFIRRLSAGEEADLSGRLFAAASHELRQPLAALSLLLGALEGRIGGGPEAAPLRGRPPPAGGSGDAVVRDLVTAMGNAVQSMRGMVDGHFDLVRLEAGLVRPDIGTPSVNGVLTRLALEAAPRFQARGLRFSVLPCSVRVRTDGTLLERILQGFIANTLRHSERGRVVMGCRRRGGELRIELWATGRGLTPAQLQTLREELRGGGDEDTGAMDLGLRLARGLARRLGHRLEVDSVAGRGSMLTVIVPCATDADDEAPMSPEPPFQRPGREPEQQPEDDVGRARVLVIEDDPMVLDALGALLGQWGCAVIGAESADAALERLGAGKPAPDLVISDLRLKGTADGIVAIRRIAKALGAEVPGLILTGDTDPMRLREARLSGYPLLHKPVAPLALRTALARLLGRERLKS